MIDVSERGVDVLVGDAFSAPRAVTALGASSGCRSGVPAKLAIEERLELLVQGVLCGA